MGFQNKKKHDNVEEEKAHLLSLDVPFSFAWKVSVHASLYDKATEEHPFPGTLGPSEGCLTIQKTALDWGCGAAPARPSEKVIAEGVIAEAVVRHVAKQRDHCEVLQ